jgi:hypothetical protein
MLGTLASFDIELVQDVQIVQGVQSCPQWVEWNSWNVLKEVKLAYSSDKHFTFVATL